MNATPSHASSVLATFALALAGQACWAAEWPTAGHDLKNSRHQASETTINNKNVAGLSVKWAFSTDGDVTANPAIDGDFLYFPDSTGSLYKVN